MKIATALLASIAFAALLVAAVVVPLTLTPGGFSFHSWPAPSAPPVAITPLGGGGDAPQRPVASKQAGRARSTPRLTHERRTVLARADAHAPRPTAPRRSERRPALRRPPAPHQAPPKAAPSTAPAQPAPAPVADPPAVAVATTAPAPADVSQASAPAPDPVQTVARRCDPPENAPPPFAHGCGNHGDAAARRGAHGEPDAPARREHCRPEGD